MRGILLTGRLSAAFCGLLFAWNCAGAAVPGAMDYQGYLTHADGSPVDTGVAVTFRMYTVETGGSPLWSQTLAILVDQGLFNVELGAVPGNGFPVGLFNTPLYMGLSVAGEAEMQPRRRLTTNAFSFRAAESDLLGGKTASQLDQSAHVTSTANPHSVTAAQVGAIGSGDLSAHTANASAHHARYTNSEAVNAIKAADGPGSGLDADTVDGVHGSDIATGLSSLESDLFALQSSVTTIQGQFVPITGGNFSGNVSVTGRMGFGTNAPAVPVHLTNSSPASEAFRIEGRDTWLAFYDGSLYDGFLWNNLGDISLGTSFLNSFGSLYFYTNGQKRMRVTQSGRVGIGNTSPLYRLHVEDSNIAIHGRSSANYGLYGYSDGQIGIYGYSNAQSSAGVYGQSAFIGVEGITNSNSTNLSRQAVRGTNFGSATGWAGYFWGNGAVTGSFSKAAGSFRIDHPLAPEKKFLSHSFVESPDMKNIYDGIVTTDGKGVAEVTLPEWFAALNKDFRYQLTVIGQFAQAIVARKIQDNRFQIASSVPDVEVSWQVTGIRKDAYANAHRIQVEEDKPAEMMGKYLHPEVFGRSVDQAIDYRPSKLAQPD